MRWFWWMYAMLRGQLLVAGSYPIDLALRLLNVVFVIAAFYFLANYLLPSTRGGGDAASSYFSFVALGIVFSSLLTTWFSSFSRELREFQTTGALEMLLATGARPTLIIVGMTLASLMLAVFEGAGALVAAKVLFRLNATVICWTALMAAILLGVTIYCCLGLMSAGFVLVFKRGNPIAFLFDKTSVLLGGVYFPVESLPVHLRSLAELLPLTHLLRLARAAVGASARDSGIATESLVLGGMAILLAVITTLTLRICIKAVLRHGTVAHY